MKKDWIKYFIITILFILCSVSILKNTNLMDNISLSKSIQIILILFLIRISYGCVLFIRKQFIDNKYSYAALERNYPYIQYLSTDDCF